MSFLKSEMDVVSIINIFIVHNYVQIYVHKFIYANLLLADLKLVHQRKV